MKNKKVVVLVLASLAVGAAFGRWLAPSRVEVKKEVVTVEKKVIDSEAIKKIELEKNRTLKKVIVEITRPDGTKEKTTRFVEKTNENKSTDTQTKLTIKEEKEKKEMESKVTEYKKPSLSVSGGAILSLDSKQMYYGGHIQKNILGPIQAGVLGFTNKTVGGTIGIQF